MLRIDRHAKQLRQVEQRAIGDRERSVQEMILRSPDAFFAEMGEKMLLLGQEITPAEVVDDRIDLLAIDQEGATVVLELKRGSHKLHLLQALAYAGMVSKWDRDRLFRERATLTGKEPDEAADEVEQFLLEDIDDLNATQRVILLAESFDYEVLVTAEWLTERYEVDIRCYRLALAAEGADEFLTCTCIYPPPEITQVALQRRHRGPGRPVAWADWTAALEAFENRALTAFFRRELEAGREGYLRKRLLRFPVAGRSRFNVVGRTKAAYVWQRGRFRGDEEFWKKRLGPDADVKAVKQGLALRFFLTTEDDFNRFREAVGHELAGTEWLAAEEAPDIDEKEVTG